MDTSHNDDGSQAPAKALRHDDLRNQRTAELPGAHRFQPLFQETDGGHAIGVQKQFVDVLHAHRCQ